MNNIALKDLREITKFANDNLLKENKIKRNSNLFKRIFLKEFWIKISAPKVIIKISQKDMLFDANGIKKLITDEYIIIFIQK